jgi:phosphatidylglycerol---prolipoprotein diacylglyceryl transferase
LHAPLPAIGIGAGRIGNFINGELWGKPTDVPWAVVVDGVALHPSQLYEAVLEGLVLFLVVWWFTARPRFRWAPAGLFMACYGVFRFAVEFVRVPDADIGYLMFGWVTMGQLLSLPMIIAGPRTARRRLPAPRALRQLRRTLSGNAAIPRTAAARAGQGRCQA